MSLTAGNDWYFFQTHRGDIEIQSVYEQHWKPINVPSIQLKNPSEGIYLWYKTTFQWDASRHDSSLALYIESIRNADETYLNDKLIGGTGEVSEAWNVWQKYPLNLTRVYPIPSAAMKPGENTLYIKINTGIGDIRGTEYFGSVGITGEVSILNETVARQRQQQLNNSGIIFDTLIITLGVVDLFLILFLFKNTFHRFPEFPWLLLNSLMMFLAALMLDIYQLMGHKYAVFGFIRYVTVFSIPFITAIYFWVQRKDVPLKLVITLFLVLLMSVILVLFSPLSADLHALGWRVMLVLTVVFFIYALYAAIRNVLQKQTGGIYQLLGLLVYMISIRTDLFSMDIFEHRNVFVGSLVFRYALLLAYFQRIKKMSHSYKDLSKRMLSTIEKHRADIARELHDGLGQFLVSSRLQSGLARRGNKEKHLDLLDNELSAAVTSLHDVVRSLHPVVLDKYSFDEALRKEGKRLNNLYGIRFNFDLDSSIVAGKEIESHLYRIFQELVNNAYKHGKAEHINVNYYSRHKKIIFTIRDDGIGYSENTRQASKNEDHQGGFGLISIRERVALINARLFSNSLRSGGVEMTVEVNV